MSYPYGPIENIGREELVLCPFDPKHKITESSLQRHVIRCRKNHPDYVSCPYNAVHFFQTKEMLMAHLVDCPSKPPPPSEKVKENEELIHMPDLANIRLWNMAHENWDDEV